MGKSMEFGEKLAHGAWSLRAAITGVLLIVAGALVGGVSGLTFGPETGGIAALCVVAVGGIFWALSRIGVAGIGLGIIGGIAGLLGATEIPHAIVVNGPMTSLASLASWVPRSGASVLHFARVEGDPRYASMRTKTYVGGKGRGNTTIHYRVLPLKERERVVGFTCTNSLRRGHSGQSGAYALSAEAWDGAIEQQCRDAAATSEKWARAAGIEVAPDSTSRIVRIYASEADLRADHDAPLAFWGPGIFLGVYLVGCIVFRVVNHGEKRETRKIDRHARTTGKC